MKSKGVIALALLLVLIAASGGFSPKAAFSAAPGAWRAEYYANPWLVGAPAVVRDEGAINWDWGWGSPAAGVPADDFSARWTAILPFEGGSYRFSVASDDGVRLFIDGRLVLDKWQDQARTTHSATVDLTAGAHAIRLEYYEHAGAAAVALWWEKVPGPFGGNIITCVRPRNSWVKVYRWEDSGWLDVNPKGYGPVDATGFLKLDGMLVDFYRYGWAGHPYKVELWADGRLITSVGDTSRGEPEFRVRPLADNWTPWGCPAP